jgi:hypothetical protein
MKKAFVIMAICFIFVSCKKESVEQASPVLKENILIKVQAINTDDSPVSEMTIKLNW